MVVQPGPAAALYGNGALGGTVLLDTGPDFRASPLRATAQAATGRVAVRGGGPVALTVLAQGTNLLNLSYYTYSARPAPPRAWLASLRVGWR